MKFTTDRITWTESMKKCAEDLATKKLGRLIDDPSDGVIRLTSLNSKNVKISLKYGDFRVQSVNEDYYVAIANAFAKMKSIITRYKHNYPHKKNNYKQVSIFDQSVDVNDSDERLDLISKEKVFNLEPMTTLDAMRQYESTDYEFYVYKDSEDQNTVSILYKRLNGTYGLIRCH